MVVAQADNGRCNLARPAVLRERRALPTHQAAQHLRAGSQKSHRESPEKSFFLSPRGDQRGSAREPRLGCNGVGRRLIERILEFSKITVKEMLRPLIDVVAIEENESLREAVRLIQRVGALEDSGLPGADRLDRGNHPGL